jgi:flagellar biosynthesis/type III secretory pathway chaperone
MATNRDLLKEAIADAKAVKETAIANAKAALEEAFTPFLKEKLAQKINEMDGLEEEETDEMYKTGMEEEKSMDKNESVEEVSLEELLAELEEGEDMNKNSMEETEISEAKEEEKEEEMSIEDMDEDDLKSFIEDVIKDMVSAGELEAGEGEEEEEEEEMEMEPEESEEEEEEEEVNIDELLAELEETEKEETNEEKEETNEEKEETNEELEEAYSTIESLKSELNEINLLNAKLLYTNKIFRNKSLTESQKIKVLTAFDKATTKKEVELVYETLQEGLKVSTVTKSPIKESLGSASKALGSATAKPIIENDAFARMRELAGLKIK